MDAQSHAKTPRHKEHAGTLDPPNRFTHGSILLFPYEKINVRQTTMEDSPWRPFCSERCKLIDFDKWTSDEYRVPGQA
jgi:hypothetical protein